MSNKQGASFKRKEAERKEWQRQLDLERSTRIHAQRGLVPYVRSLQAFNEWLGERPELQTQLEPILRELGLWDIKLAYDPDTDPALVEQRLVSGVVVVPGRDVVQESAQGDGAAQENYHRLQNGPSEHGRSLRLDPTLRDRA